MKILVIEACGLHLGYLGCYGNDWVATPNLDRLAVEGITFDWHFADQPELQSSTVWLNRSVGTGHYTFPGQASAGLSRTVNPRIIRCAAITSLAKQTVNAVEGGGDWLWIEGPSLLPPWQMDDELLEAYFDEDDVEEGLTPWPDPPLGLVKLNEAEILQLQNTYAAAVTVFDAQLGVALERLRERGLLDDTLLCVTARSGLPLGEHGMIGVPPPCLHDELVHVPLLLRLPGAADAGMRIGALTQPLDLLPTFLEALGQPVPPMHGRNLWPLIRGEAETVRPYAVSALRVGLEESLLLRTREWAFHLPVGQAFEPDGEARSQTGEPDVRLGERTPQLYVKPGDRWEVNDLYQQQIEIADPMARALHAFAEAIRQPGELAYPVFV
jgi:arylsulfatase A-like enzyme